MTSSPEPSADRRLTRVGIVAKRGLRASPGQRCGSHGVAGYLARLEAMRRIFERLATET